MEKGLELFLTGLILGNTLCVFSSCSISMTLYLPASGKNAKEALKSLCVFTLSRLLIYVLIGAAAGISGMALNKWVGSYTFQISMSVLSGVLLVATGIYIISGKKTKGLACKHKGIRCVCHGQGNVALMGIVLGLLPCAPFINMVTQVMLTTKSPLVGMMLGLLFGLGAALCVPLWAVGIFMGYAPQKILSNQKIYRGFVIACGALLVITGIKYVLPILHY